MATHSSGGHGLLQAARRSLWVSACLALVARAFHTAEHDNEGSMLLLGEHLVNDTAPQLIPAEFLSNSTLHNASEAHAGHLQHGNMSMKAGFGEAPVNKTGDVLPSTGALEEPAANGSKTPLAPTSADVLSNSSDGEGLQNVSSKSLTLAEVVASHNNGNGPWHGRSANVFASKDDGRTVAVLGALVPLCLFLCCQYDKICKIKPSARRVKAPRVQVRQGLQVVCQEQATMSANGTDFMEMDANEDTDEDTCEDKCTSASQQLTEALPEAWQEAIAEATGQTLPTAYYDLSTPR